MIMIRTLRRDISQYNQLETAEEAQEETGWKLVHGDVFRPPHAPGMLAVHVGTGVQLFGMTFITMLFAVLGFLSPANRGGLMTAMLLLFVLMGVFAGYYSARLYKMFQLTEWKAMTAKTAFMFPGVVFAIFFTLNLLIWGERSSGAVPFGTLAALSLLWFGARALARLLARSLILGQQVFGLTTPHGVAQTNSLQSFASSTACRAPLTPPARLHFHHFSSNQASRCRWCLWGHSSGSRSRGLKTPCARTRSRGRSPRSLGTCSPSSRSSSAGSSPSELCS